MTDHLNSPRITFNFGFHDATADAERGRPNRAYGEGHPMPPAESYPGYEAGYRAGYADFVATGKRADSSEPAWIEHQAALA